MTDRPPRLSYSDALRARFGHPEQDPGGNVLVTAPYPVAPDELPDLYLVQHEAGPVTLMICTARAWDVLAPVTGHSGTFPDLAQQSTWLERDTASVMFDRIADTAAAAGLELQIEYVRAGRDPHGIDYTTLRKIGD